MTTPSALFEQYTELRLQGQSPEEAQRNLIYGIQRLPISDQVSLKQRLQKWEDERTEAYFDLEERMKLSNITMKIVFCPVCESPNALETSHCHICGSSLVVEDYEETADTAQLITPFEKESLLILQVLGTAKHYVLHPQKALQGIRLGRTKMSYPDLDLSDARPEDLGISRWHAMINYDIPTQTVYITDLNSTNGTFINGMRLPADTRSRLHHGDELTLGRLRLNIAFQEIINKEGR